MKHDVQLWKDATDPFVFAVFVISTLPSIDFTTKNTDSFFLGLSKRNQINYSTSPTTIISQ